MLLPPYKQPDMLRIFRSCLLGNAREDIGRSYWSTPVSTTEWAASLCCQCFSNGTLAYFRTMPKNHTKFISSIMGGIIACHTVNKYQPLCQFQDDSWVGLEFSIWPFKDRSSQSQRALRTTPIGLETASCLQRDLSNGALVAKTNHYIPPIFVNN